MATSAAVLIATALIPPTITQARELEFQASILDHQASYLLVKTSGDERLQFDLGWFKNTDGYALKRDEFYCFDVESQPNGKLMLVSVQTCDTGTHRDPAAEENELPGNNT